MTEQAMQREEGLGVVSGRGVVSAGVGGRENLPRVHGFELLEVEGVLPEDLRGTLVRNGPGVSERFGHHYDHVFEADGAISAVRFEGGHAKGAVRFVETPYYLEEQRRERLLYGGKVVWVRRMLNMMRGKIKQPMNVNVMHHQGRLFAMSDGAIPFEIDPVTLAGLGFEDFEGLVLGAHSAHPHWVETRQTLYNFSMIYGRQTEIEIYAFPLEGKPRRIARVPISGVTYAHDFIVTENHAVFFLSPVRVSVWRSLLQIGGLGEMLQWRPEFGTEIVVIPLDRPEEYTRFETDPFFQWHFANAFERDGEIVVDYVRHRDFATLDEINEPSGDVLAEERLHRAFVDPKGKRFRSVELWGQRCEFPSVAGAWRGREADVLWMVGEDQGREGLVRFDISTKKVRHMPLEEGQEVSEPIFVSRSQPQAEDDGYVLMLTYDRASHRSFVGVYEGKAPQAGPIAKVWFAHHIPTTFHGTWIAA